MKTKFILLMLFLILIQNISYSYDVYEVSEQMRATWYGTGVTINPKTGEKELETYKDYKERNQKVPYDQYFCLTIPDKTYGYLVNKSAFGSVGYVYQTDNYSYYEKVKCAPNVDSYPVINSMKEIKSNKR